MAPAPSVLKPFYTQLNCQGHWAQVVKLVREQMEAQLPEVEGLPCIGMSALTGTGATAIMPTVTRLYSVWNQRIPTARLNKWLVEVRYPPRRVSLRSGHCLSVMHAALDCDLAAVC